MRLDRLVFVSGAALLGLGTIAAIGVGTGGDPLALRLIPALFLRLPRPLIGGGDFPPSLSGAGIVVVYLIPGAALLIIGLLWRARRAAPSRSSLTDAP